MIKAIAFDYGGVIELKDGDFVQEIADSLETTKYIGYTPLLFENNIKLEEDLSKIL